MGGDTLPPCFASEDESSLDSDCLGYQPHHTTFYRDGDESVSGSSEGFYDMGQWKSSNPIEFDGNLRRRKNAYKEIMKNYDELWVRRETLHQAKSKILSYTPGAWISNAGNKKRSNYVIPKTATLLLIGPKGSGKSSLVNKISRVFEDDKFTSERAQVTYNPSSGEGTYFLQEYMIPRNSSSFCLFDTRSLSGNFVDNDEMLQRWMKKGVRHGELVLRDSDSSSLKMALRCKAQQSGSPSSELRKVNFVIVVVNGYSVLRAMNGDKKEDKTYMEMVSEIFSSPYLSFKDDKPAIVVTHGDLLSLGDRARVRIYLGEKLGVPPAKQIFDIPESSDSSTELMIIDLMRYTLEHADKNLPYRESIEWVNRTNFSEDGIKNKVFRTSILTVIFLTILLGIACVAFPTRQPQKHDEPRLTPSINWHSKFELNQPYKPHEPQTSYQSNSQSESAVTHFSESLTSYPSNSQSKSAVNHSQEQRNVNHETQDESEPTLPTNSIVATSAPSFPSERVVTTSEPTVNLKSVVHRPCKQRDSRSPSPEYRHPKMAVKWHKIRHLWLDSD